MPADNGGNNNSGWIDPEPEPEPTPDDGGNGNGADLDTGTDDGSDDI